MIDWQNTPTVFLPKLRCPSCGEPGPLLVRSERAPCGDQVRKHVCRTCSRPFRAIIERQGELEILNVAENWQSEIDTP